MRYALYAIAAFHALGAILAVNSIGKPRKPMSPGVAAWAVVISAAIATALVLAARALS